MIDIDVVDAFQMREHRHARLGFDAGDQALAAARHDHVDAAVQPAQQQADRRAVAGRHQGDRGLGQTGFAQSLHQTFVDRAAGPETVRAAAQDHGVAGFQAQHAGVGGDVGAAFENHGDDAERHAYPLDDHAVRPLPALGHDADGIGDLAHGRDAVGHRVDARLRQRQPIDEGAARAGAADFRDILGIGGEDRGRIGADGALHRLQRLVLLLGGGQRQHPRGGARAGSKLGHQGRQIGACRRWPSAARSCRFQAQLRRCPSTEIRRFAKCGGGMAGAAPGQERVLRTRGQLGHWPSSGKMRRSAPPRDRRGGSFPRVR